MTTPTTTPQHHAARAKSTVAPLVAVWLAVVAAGWWCIERYDFAVNDLSTDRFVERWPEGSALARSQHQPTLLLFLHPKCPCSEASVNELNRMFTSLADRATSAPELLVVAAVPSTAESTWWQTNVVARSQQIAHAKLFVDRGGREAARFGATTSGFVMLFNEHGKRLYAGGITLARGQEGANAGRDRLTAIIRGEKPQGKEIPAFGCRLCLPESNAGTGVAKQPPQDAARTRSSI